MEMLRNLLRLSVLCVLAVSSVSGADDGAALDKEYKDLFRLSYYGEGAKPEEALERMVSFIERHLGYDPGGAGLGLVGNIGYVINRLPADRRDAAWQRAMQSIDDLLHKDGVSNKTRALACVARFAATVDIEHRKDTPDTARVRTALDDAVRAYTQAFGEDESALVETMRMRERYARMLASADADAAIDYIEDLRAAGGDATTQQLNGLIEQMRLWRTPLELSFTALDHRKMDVAKLRGKVVLVNFTGVTWCGGCRLQEPVLKAVYDKYHARGFEIVSIAIEDGPDKRAKVEKLVAERGLPWPHGFDGLGMKSPLMEKYQISGVPTMWLLGRDGRLVSAAAFGEYLEPLVRRSLGM